MVESQPTRDNGDVFVGRQTEMAELTATLDAALTGQGRLIMLAGEPGIGKTRMHGTRIGCLCQRTRRSGAVGLVLRGRGRPALLALGPLDTIGHLLWDANRDLQDSVNSDRHAGLQGL